MWWVDDGKFNWAPYSGSGRKNFQRLTNRKMTHLNNPFENCKTFRISKSVRLLSRNHNPDKTRNGHVYAICCQLEEPGEVISGKKCKDYWTLRAGKFWSSYGSSSFPENNPGLKFSHSDGEGDGGGCGINASCSRLKRAMTSFPAKMLRSSRTISLCICE